MAGLEYVPILDKKQFPCRNDMHLYPKRPKLSLVNQLNSLKPNLARMAGTGRVTVLLIIYNKSPKWVKLLLALSSQHSPHIIAP